MVSISYLVKGVPNVVLHMRRKLGGNQCHLEAVGVGVPVAVVTNRPVHNFVVTNESVVVGQKRNKIRNLVTDVF